MPYKLALAGALALTVMTGVAQAQMRLYLEDGTWLLVKSYSIQGNRVRYYSIGDAQWEEMPLSLVDLKATERAEAEKKAEQHKILQEAQQTAQDNTRYQFPKNTGYSIAPGVRLPAQQGVYAYDGLRIITLLRSQCSMTRDRRRAMLKAALAGPFLKGESVAVLAGPTAAVQILSQNPVFYVKLASIMPASIVLLRLKEGKRDRAVEKVASGWQGKLTESRAALPIKITEIHSGLFKLVPSQSLSPGEYALGEVSQNKLDLDVWAFGILSPNAPVPKQGERSAFPHGRRLPL